MKEGEEIGFCRLVYLVAICKTSPLAEGYAFEWFGPWHSNLSKNTDGVDPAQWGKTRWLTALQTPSFGSLPNLSTMRIKHLNPGCSRSSHCCNSLADTETAMHGHSTSTRGRHAKGGPSSSRGQRGRQPQRQTPRSSAKWLSDWRTPLARLLN